MRPRLYEESNELIIQGDFEPITNPVGWGTNPELLMMQREEAMARAEAAQALLDEVTRASPGFQEKVKAYKAFLEGKGPKPH